ncbi:hypothetical protein [Terriglobus roseus]|nr:hypothetical protein [Terriglobus roseus]
MIQVLVANKISQDHGLELSDIVLDEWNIRIPSLDHRASHGRQDSSFHGRHHIDRKRLQAICESGEADRLLFKGYGQRMENLPSLEFSRNLFRRQPVNSACFGDDYLVCNIRGAEVLRAVHPHYVVHPIAFYKELLASTGLKPVFLGQLGDDDYSMSLRRSFPSAEFVPSGGALQDFESIRNSINIVPAVSTFSWLSSWLSYATNIYFPVNGLLNPRQYPPVDLLPLRDPRYRFYLFPLNYSVFAEELHIAHGAINGMWQHVPSDELSTSLNEAVRVERDLQGYLEQFDECYYLQQHRDVADAVRQGRWRDGRAHYIDRGFRENRSCFAMSLASYSRRYPEAAWDVAKGKYVDLRHHFVSVGRTTGFIL